MHTQYVTVRLGVLALLDEGPSHGYQLKSDFEARTGGVWTVNVGQIYTVLDRLRKDGLAEPDDADGDGDRRPWKITSAGRKVVDAWFAEAAVTPAPTRDELLIKVLVAIGRSPATALGVIDTQRNALYFALQAERHTARVSHSGNGVSDGSLAARIMAEAVRARHEADLSWLDRCEELVRTTNLASSREEHP